MSATEDKKAVPETEVDEEEDDTEHAEPEEEEKDDLDNDDDQEPVLLGFVQDPVHVARCRRQYFPSKVGGKPAWLNPRDLPSIAQLSCDECKEPLRFLMQVYAEKDEVSKNAFHRSLFVFVCGNGQCLSKAGSVKVYRSQLPESNPFYSAVLKKPTAKGKPDPAERAALEDEPWSGVDLCVVCGLPGPKACSKCRTARYCGRAHQIAHWRAGHSAACGQEAKAEPSAGKADGKESKQQWEAAKGEREKLAKSLFEELEIQIEDEEFEDEVAAAKAKQLLENYEKEQSEMSAEEKAEETESFKDHNVRHVDPVTSTFHTRISYAPEQILRYDSRADAAPLWFCSEGRLEAKDVPPCPSCKGPRVFEFQVMPQLLDELKVDSEQSMDLGRLSAGRDTDIDFATVAVFTCAGSCGDGLGERGYLPEFAHVQRAPLLLSAAASAASSAAAAAAKKGGDTAAAAGSPAESKGASSSGSGSASAGAAGAGASESAKKAAQKKS